MEARLIAFYLPQFHPTPDNDIFWEPGFTEWTNVGKAKPLYHGHSQPKLPTELGYYDLRVPETRALQAELAHTYGVEGFCYWHYWFGNKKQMLERPLQEVVASGEPDFPFCIAWANESWHGFDHGLKQDSFLIEQCYPGEADNTEHFMSLLPAFRDRRYLTVDGKLLFLIYKPLENPGAIRQFVAQWRQLAVQYGLPGFYFVGITYFPASESQEILNLGFDGINVSRFHDYKKVFPSMVKWATWKQKLFGLPMVVPYAKVAETQISEEEKAPNVFPTVYSNWDHTPRSGRRGVVFHGSTPELFRKVLAKAIDVVRGKKPDYRLIFLKSWNEWAEGNYVEPDREFGRGYLEAIAETVDPAGSLRQSEDKPLVSVLIAAYNQEKYLSETIESLQGQTYSNWEAIIVDDGSPDNVGQIAKELASRDSRIKFYHTPNQGVSAARNFAASKAGGKYIMSLDGDDILLPGYIALCVNVLESRPEVRVAYTQWKFFGAKKHFIRLNYHTYKDEVLSNQIHVSAMLRKEDFDRCGGFDTQMTHGLEDWEFWIRAIGQDTPNSVYMHPEALFLYRQKRRSHNTMAIGKEQRMRNQQYIFNKHRELYHNMFGDIIRPEFLTYVNAMMIENLTAEVDATDADASARFIKGAVNIAKLMARAVECPEGIRLQILGDIRNKLEPLAGIASGHLSAKNYRRFRLLLKSPQKFLNRMHRSMQLQPKNWPGLLSNRFWPN